MKIVQNLLKAVKYIMIVFGVVITSCSPKIASNTNVEAAKVLYPKESDTARIQFLRSYSNSSDIAAVQTAFNASIVGKEIVSNIEKPYGVSIRNGKIYICDLANNTIKIIDLENKSFKEFTPKLKKGVAVSINNFVDEDGSLYLANPRQGIISVYDSKNEYLTEFGGDIFKNPIDLVVKNNKIYVADLGNNRVNIFNKATKEFEGYFPESVEGNTDWLYSPTAISISDDRIYVTDTGDFTVKIYSLEGKHIMNIGGIGDNMGQFSRPKGLAADKEDNVYVLDAAFENAQIFNIEGKLLMFFGGAYNGPGDMYLPVQITIDYENTKYFEKLVDKRYDLKYLIIVSNQFGPEKISVYGRIELKK